MRIVTITVEGLPNTGKTAIGEVVKRKLESLNLNVELIDSYRPDQNHDQLWVNFNPEDIVKILKDNDVGVQVILKEQKR